MSTCARFDFLIWKKNRLKPVNCLEDAVCLHCPGLIFLIKIVCGAWMLDWNPGTVCQEICPRFGKSSLNMRCFQRNTWVRGVCARLCHWTAFLTPSSTVGTSPWPSSHGKNTENRNRNYFTHFPSSVNGDSFWAAKSSHEMVHWYHPEGLRKNTLWLRACSSGLVREIFPPKLWSRETEEAAGRSTEQ